MRRGVRFGTVLPQQLGHARQRRRSSARPVPGRRSAVVWGLDRDLQAWGCFRPWSSGAGREFRRTIYSQGGLAQAELRTRKSPALAARCGWPAAARTPAWWCRKPTTSRTTSSRKKSISKISTPRCCGCLVSTACGSTHRYQGLDQRITGVKPATLIEALMAWGLKTIPLNRREAPWCARTRPTTGGCDPFRVKETYSPGRNAYLCIYPEEVTYPATWVAYSPCPRVRPITVLLLQTPVEGGKLRTANPDPSFTAGRAPHECSQSPPSAFGQDLDGDGRLADHARRQQQGERRPPSHEWSVTLRWPTPTGPMPGVPSRPSH